MKTKAVRIHGKMDLRLEEIDLPEVGPDVNLLKKMLFMYRIWIFREVGRDG